MEVSALKHAGAAVPSGGSALLRIQSDERLIAMIRRGNQSAFEALVSRYHSRLFAFCRHMLGSKEDAEDVLQEVFASSYNALLADDRPINARPWLYRIARNRCLNHLRRAQAIGVDSMDIHIADGGVTTADKVHKREEFRQLMADVRELPETQKTALLLREIDALSYDQISEVMETTVPSVKSLLVRARVSLAEAAEARLLSCEEVRIELGEVAEGLKRISPPVRRHVKNCERCKTFKSQLKATNKSLAALLPIGPLIILKKFVIGHVGVTAASSGAGAAGSAAAGGAFSAGISTIATKAAAGITAAALVTVGTVEVKQTVTDRPAKSDTPAIVAAASPPVAASVPVVAKAKAQPKVSEPKNTLLADSDVKAEENAASTDTNTTAATPPTTTTTETPTTETNTQTAPKSQEVNETIALPNEQAPPPPVVTPTQPAAQQPTTPTTQPTTSTPTESTPTDSDSTTPTAPGTTSESTNTAPPVAP